SRSKVQGGTAQRLQKLILFTLRWRRFFRYPRKKRPLPSQSCTLRGGGGTKDCLLRCGIFATCKFRNKSLVVVTLEGVDDLGIKLSACGAPDSLDRFIKTDRLVVAALARHRIKGIGEREDASFERALFTAKLIGIAGAVPTLVVAADERQHIA